MGRRGERRRENSGGGDVDHFGITRRSPKLAEVVTCQICVLSGRRSDFPARESEKHLVSPLSQANPGWAENGPPGTFEKPPIYACLFVRKRSCHRRRTNAEVVKIQQKAHLAHVLAKRIYFSSEITFRKSPREARGRMGHATRVLEGARRGGAIRCPWRHLPPSA